MEVATTKPQLFFTHTGSYTLETSLGGEKPGGPHFTIDSLQLLGRHLGASIADLAHVDDKQLLEEMAAM